MDDVAFPFTHNLRLEVLIKKEVCQWHVQHNGDPLERLQGRHGFAVLKLTDKARGDPRTLRQLHGRQAPRLAHMANLFPEIHGPSLLVAALEDGLALIIWAPPFSVQPGRGRLCPSPWLPRRRSP